MLHVCTRFSDCQLYVLSKCPKNVDLTGQNAIPSKVPPRWTVEPQDQSVVLGNAVVITCKADGFPMPTVLWKQAIGEQTGEYRELGRNGGGSDGGNVANNNNNGNNGNLGGANASIESHANGSLIIGRVGQEHAGHFLCQATNGIGADLSKLIRLTVHGTFDKPPHYIHLTFRNHMHKI